MAKGNCSVEDCDRGVLAKGFCNAHYTRNRKYGDPLYVASYKNSKPSAPPEQERPLCAGPECTRTLDPIQNRSGLCKSHYKQRHLGKPLTPLRVATKDLGRPKTCTFPGCTNPHKARGFCKGHNDHIRAGKDLQALQLRLPPGPCAVDECGRPRHAAGMCARHYSNTIERWRSCGLTPETGRALYEQQGGLCAVCLQPAPLADLHIDHDHSCCPSIRRSCGKCVRGLLCQGCNLGLGYLKDDVERLRSAINYLALVPQ